ncbi:hypothetical protein CDAR_7801 [Caerostris darwini]|uniref:Uncharacterized protein n=1 Tax=Caerostris darwini TaxID=1538125 RepID=A0AAV4Q9K0_9ARAC|nr:hypothetical protein CDAR_7801 [Caerostris darwini]
MNPSIPENRMACHQESQRLKQQVLFTYVFAEKQSNANTNLKHTTSKLQQCNLETFLWHDKKRSIHPLSLSKALSFKKIYVSAFVLTFNQGGKTNKAVVSYCAAVEEVMLEREGPTIAHDGYLQILS